VAVPGVRRQLAPREGEVARVAVFQGDPPQPQRSAEGGQGVVRVAAQTEVNCELLQRLEGEGAEGSEAGNVGLVHGENEVVHPRRVQVVCIILCHGTNEA
jgi:hypothetical protein